MADRPSFPFRARFNGTCAADCGERVHEGDMVQYVDEKLVHHGCVPDESPEPPPRPICPSCYTTIALNGACLC